MLTLCLSHKCVEPKTLTFFLARETWSTLPSITGLPDSTSSLIKNFSKVTLICWQTSFKSVKATLENVFRMDRRIWATTMNRFFGRLNLTEHKWLRQLGPKNLLMCCEWWILFVCDHALAELACIWPWCWTNRIVCKIRMIQDSFHITRFHETSYALAFQFDKNVLSIKSHAGICSFEKCLSMLAASHFSIWTGSNGNSKDQGLPSTSRKEQTLMVKCVTSWRQSQKHTVLALYMLAALSKVFAHDRYPADMRLFNSFSSSLSSLDFRLRRRFLSAACTLRLQLPNIASCFSIKVAHVTTFIALERSSQI